MRWFRDRSDKVVRLTRHSALAEVEAYWDALRETRAVPSRSEIDPRGIQRALPNAFILEQIAPSFARIRVAGSQLNDLMGMETRGMPVSSLFQPEARGELARTLNKVFDMPARARISLRGQPGFGKPELVAQMLLLPMMDDFGDVTRILGCVAYDGAIGQTPRRFSIDSVVLTPASALCEEEPQVAVPQTAAEKAPAPKGRAHLRLVVENGA